MDYTQAGVDIAKGNTVVDRIKPLVASTAMPSMLKGIGSFASFYDLEALLKTYRHPVLVQSTDGVGTKLKIAHQLGIHDTVGIDLVAMCVNDVLCHGAEPLFFLDYIAAGKVDPEKTALIVSGIATGCKKAGAALIGGETAEMPDMYRQDEYDLAGFAVGIVEMDQIIDGSKTEKDDLLIGIPSSGLHSNGYSLVRKILFKDNSINDDAILAAKTLKEHLMTPTRIYVKTVLPVLKKFPVRAVVHVTGGGFDENIPRVLKPELGVVIDEVALPKLPIFDFLQEVGKLDRREMYNVFNMGIGMILIVSPVVASAVLEYFASAGEAARIIGRITDCPGVVIR